MQQLGLGSNCCLWTITPIWLNWNWSIMFTVFKLGIYFIALLELSFSVEAVHFSCLFQTQALRYENVTSKAELDLKMGASELLSNTPPLNCCSAVLFFSHYWRKFSPKRPLQELSMEILNLSWKAFFFYWEYLLTGWGNFYAVRVWQTVKSLNYLYCLKNVLLNMILLWNDVIMKYNLYNWCICSNLNFLWRSIKL